MNILALLDNLNFSNISEFLFNDGALIIRFNWDLSLMQFKQIAAEIKKLKPTQLDIFYDEFKIIIRN
jgi:hypothetical protein